MASSTVLSVRTASSQNSNSYNTGSIIAAPNNTCVLASWEQAIELFNSKLTQDEKKKIDLNNCRSASFEELLKAATDAKTLAERKRFRWTPTIRKIFQQINRYAVAGDVIAQYSTQYTSIAWGAFRFLLLFVVEEGTMAEKLSEALDSLISIVLRAQEYAVLFSSHSGSSTAGVFAMLQDHLIHLYAEVLNFLVRATIFFTRGTLRRYVSAGFASFDTQFKSILDRVGQLESNVGKDVALLNSEAENQRQEYEDGVWLKPADFSTNLDDQLRRHLLGTCNWFLHSDTYGNWRESSKYSSTPNLLWVQGKPGCGKSTLAAQIVTDLKLLADNIICYVFCKSGEENKSDLKDILRNIIHQILCAASRLKPSFNQIVRNARLSARTPHAQNIAQLWSLLQQMLGKEVQVCCVIDGLDECSNTVEDQVSFLNHISGIFHAAKATARLAVISRLDKSELNDASLWTSIQIQSSDVQGDIEKLVSVKLRESAVLNGHREKDRLQTRLVEYSDGMILWAELMIKELEAGHWNVDRVLQHPPRGLGAVYAAIFRRLSTSPAIAEVQHILQLLLVTARPLHLDELSMGLALLKGLRSHEDYILQGDPDREGKDITRMSTPLLTVMPDKTVQLAHSSLKEFLLETEEGARGVLDFGSGNFRFKLTDLHSALASCLITYLSFECFKDEAREEGLQATLFNGNSLLEYSTLYLITHCTQSPPSTVLAGKLVSFFHSVSGWQWLQRLEIAHSTSFGHLQLMQSQLRSWSNSPYVDDNHRNILGNFLMVLAQQRYEDNKVLPAEHVKSLAAMSALAKSCREHGKYDRAEELQVQVMETTKRILGEEHLSTLSSMANLASIFWHQGRWKEAEERYSKIIEIRKKLLGKEHPDTLSSIGNLASTFLIQGRWKEAEELNLQVTEVRKKVLGGEHPDTLNGMGNLALIFQNQERWKEAEELNIQVIEISKRILGKEHPDTLIHLSNLATVVWYQGRWKEAEDLHVHIINLRKKVLGNEHPNTLFSMHNLAWTWKSQDRNNEAIQLMAECVELRKKILGVDHPQTKNSLDILEEWQREESLLES